jgi:hypothetical protein
MGEKGLNNRAGVGHAGALDHQAVKVDFAAIAAVEQVEQGVFQFVGAGAADAAVGQGFDLRGAIANQLIVNGDFAEFVFDDGDFEAVLLVQDMAQQGGFTGAEKPVSRVTAIGVMFSPLAAADAAFSTSAVARFLALAEEFGVGHVRLIRMVGLHMLNVVVIVRNANQHFRRLTEVFFCFA